MSKKNSDSHKDSTEHKAKNADTQRDGETPETDPATLEEKQLAEGEAASSAEALAEQEQAETAEEASPEAAELARAAAEAERATQEVAALKDQLLRLAADFDNYRKRARREQDEVRQTGISRLLGDVLPVLDNLERALAHTDGEDGPLVQGIRLVAKQFSDVLGRHGVKGFSSVGEPFDPERHEAMGQVPSAEHKPGTVVAEIQRGYMLHDRLLRPARVMVGVAAQPTDKSNGKPEAKGEGDAVSQAD